MTRLDQDQTRHIFTHQAPSRNTTSANHRQTKQKLAKITGISTKIPQKGLPSRQPAARSHPPFPGLPHRFTAAVRSHAA
jgi:hypothetical protein